MNTALPRRVWLEIDLAVLRENFRKIREAVSPCRVLPVLKANAYGLGGLPIARALAAAGAECFGVAEPYEALELLPLGKPVQILSSVLPEEIPEMVKAGVVLPVTDLETARLIDAAADRPVRVHLKMDTGMGRLGIFADHLAVVERIRRECPKLVFEGIFTHFPMAYRRDDGFTLDQIVRFRNLIADLAGKGITFERMHCANSDAVNNFPEACTAPFNQVRAGINLHGSFDSEGNRRLHLKSVLTLKTRLTAVRTLPAGTTVGYGRSYRIDRPTRMGTISAGYADGLPLALSNRGHVLIRGRKCPVAGRVSMDYTTVVLDDVPEASVGDEVICLGGSISPEDWAAAKQTHPYEIICSFGNRVERRYLNEDNS